MTEEKFVCPKCAEENPGMIEQRNHRREQVELFCNVCGFSWTHYFKNIPKEKIEIPIKEKK